MAHFKYVALSRDGVRVSGIAEGYNELDAASRIKESCDVILKLTEVKEKKPGLLSMDIGGSRLNSKAFTVMCSQFAIILEAGIPIARAVKLVADKTVDKTLKRVMDKVAKDVEGGRSLSAAFADHGEKILPVTFTETLRAGEATGNLGRSFETMHEHFDQQEKMRAKVRSAMAYPIFVMIVAIAVVIVLMVVVVPKFTRMFAEMGGELPLPTRMLIGISGFFSHYGLLLLAILAVVLLSVKLYGNTESGRLRLARWKLKLPIFGKIEELNAASQFANTMAALMGAGLTMDKAVSITSRVIDNYHLSWQTGKLAEQLETGHALGTSMREQTDYPDILIDMAGVGESSGEMEKTLGTIAQYYDAELEEATKSALAKLEPALLIGLAAIAGFIVVAIYSAIFSLYGSMGNM